MDKSFLQDLSFLAGETVVFGFILNRVFKFLTKPDLPPPPPASGNVQTRAKRQDHFLRDTRGFVMVMAAILLPVLIGSLGLVVDVGNLYAEKAALVAAADATALAGAISLVDPDGNPCQSFAEVTAREFAEEKYQATPTITTGTWDLVNRGFSSISPPGEADKGQPVSHGMRVSMNKSVPLFFAGIFGMTSTEITANAVAVKENATDSQGATGSGTFTGFFTHSAKLVE